MNGRPLILREAEEALEYTKHTKDQIVYIGSSDGYSCTWDEFVELARKDDEHYYSGYGGQTLAKDLTIVFSDGEYLRRYEYDGAESWEIIKPFIIPTERKPISHIANGDTWATLKEMNQMGGKYGDN